MNSTLKGTLCGIGAAVCYGTNPLGALPLYAEGINTNSVLFYRYGIATLMLALFMLWSKKTFTVTARELAMLFPLGVVFALSSLTLFVSFHYMAAGVACTLLFVYPVMVAVMMAVFFKERVTVVTIVSILMALTGIVLLYHGGDGVALNTIGVLLVMASSLTYAVYIIAVNKMPMCMSSVKLTFYVLLFGLITIMVFSIFGGDMGHLQLLTTHKEWACAAVLGFFPTVMSLILMAISVKEVGSTPTAVMGALEPLTAVVLGICLFGEVLTLRLAVGILLILSAVILIVMGKQLSSGSITTAVSRLGHVIRKHWRWK